MAKIRVEFDTVDKTLTATVDGKAVADVYGVSIYRGYCCGPDGDADDMPYRCELTTLSENEDDKTEYWTRVTAAEGSGELVPAAEPKPDVSAAIAQFLARE